MIMKKSFGKRILVFIAVLMLASMSNIAAVFADETEPTLPYTLNAGVYKIDLNGGASTIDNTYTSNAPVHVTGNGTLTLNNVAIDVSKAGEASNQASAIKIEGNVKIIVSGNVALTGNAGGAGIEVPAAANLTLEGAGTTDSLTAIGNNSAEEANPVVGAAGIGSINNANNGKKSLSTIGNITINNLSKLVAKGYGRWAAGIGGDYGDITISNVDSLSAHGAYPKLTPTDWGNKGDPEAGAGIGGASISNADAPSYTTGNISIANTGLTEVYGGNKAAAIGSACWSGFEAGSKITLTNCTFGDIEGGASGAAIGLGRYNHPANGIADIAISGCTMADGGVITGGTYAAGIGTGYTPNIGNDTSAVTKILINNSSLDVSGGEAAAAIGGGYRIGKYDIDITASTIYAKAGVLTKYNELLKNGASAIGGGAYGSGLSGRDAGATARFSGAAISIDESSDIIAISNGGKWAISAANDMNTNITAAEVDTTGIKADVLQVRYLTEDIQGQVETAAPFNLPAPYGFEKGDSDCEIIDENRDNTVTVGGRTVELPAGYRSIAVTVGKAGDFTVEGTAVGSSNASYAKALASGEAASTYTTNGLKGHDYTAAAVYSVSGLSSFDYVAYRANTVIPVPEPDPTPTTPDPTPTTPDPAPTPVTPTPTTPAAATPLFAAVTPAGPAATVIADAPTPLATIEDQETPKAAAENHWALLNLLLTIFAALASILLIILYFTDKRREDEEYDDEMAQMDSENEDDRLIKRKGLPRILSAVWAVAMIIVFFLTEDMSLPMVITDEWTWLMAAMAIVQAVIAFCSKKKYDEDDEDVAEI